MKDRKWKLALWGMLLGTLLSIVAVIGWFMDKESVLGILGQGLGIVTLIFGGYSTANVAQKNVISKNYKPELDERKVE